MHEAITIAEIHSVRFIMIMSLRLFALKLNEICSKAQQVM